MNSRSAQVVVLVLVALPMALAVADDGAWSAVRTQGGVYAQVAVAVPGEDDLPDVPGEDDLPDVPGEDDLPDVPA